MLRIIRRNAWFAPLVLCLTVGVAPAVTYPTGGSNSIASVTFEFVAQLPLGGSPYTPERGYFQLKSSPGFAGGWLHVTAASSSLPAQASLAGNAATIEFPVKIDQLGVMGSVPQAIRDQIR